MIVSLDPAVALLHQATSAKLSAFEQERAERAFGAGVLAQAGPGPHAARHVEAEQQHASVVQRLAVPDLQAGLADVGAT